MSCHECKHWSPWPWVANIWDGFCKKHAKPWMAHGGCDDHESIESKGERTMKCKFCGSENGHWASIYDWHCHDCGKVTID